MNIETNKNGKTLLFILNYRRIPTWNGYFAGEKDIVAKTVRLTKKIEQQLLMNDINLKQKQNHSFYYKFDDGWSVSVDMYLTDASKSRILMKKSDGFHNYDWMCESIIRNGVMVYENN